MQNATQETKKAVLLKVFSRDIELFGKFFFPHYVKNDTPSFHREIYQAFQDETLHRIAVAAPRGHAKSTITDLIFLAWAVCNKKAHFILLISDTYSQSVLFLDALKGELESNERIRAFYGKLTTPKWSEGEIVANDIMVKALGAGMKVRGLKFREYRPNLVIGDDLENDEAVENKEQREKFERWMSGALIPCLAKDGRLIIIGTILHYDSLLSKMLAPDTYTEFKKLFFKAINDYGPLWPEHLNLEELEKIKQDYISKGQGYLFYQEYQNDPVSSENRKFKIEKFKYITDKQAAELDGKMVNYFITIDRAYSTAKTADFTAIIVNAVDSDNNWFIVQAERFKGEERDLIQKIFDLKSHYRPIKIGIEQKAFKYTLEPTLKDEMRKRNTFFIVEELKDLGKSKNVRIEGLLPRFESGSVFLRKDQTDLIDELIKFPKALHDDLCLVGETLVATINGDKKIKDIKTGDKVITPFGIKSVIESRETGIKNVIERIGIIGTSNHPVFVDNKFDKLDALRYNSNVNNLTLKNLCRWKYQKLLSSMVSSMDSWEGKESIILVSRIQMLEGKILKDCTLRFGSFIIKCQLAKGLLFIIKTAILLITTFIIWNGYRLGNICQTIIKKIEQTQSLLKKKKKISIKLETLQKSGTLLKKGKNGTPKIQNNNGKIVKILNWFARSVVKFLSHRSRIQNSVQKTADQYHGKKEIQIGDQESPQKVYNIEVDGAHCFYANGVLVGNCDALSYQLSLAKAPRGGSGGTTKHFIPAGIARKYSY